MTVDISVDLVISDWMSIALAIVLGILIVLEAIKIGLKVWELRLRK